MSKKRYAKLVHEGEYVAEVDMELIETDSGWSPYLSLDDAFKLDDVREALRRGDVRTASRQARLFTLTPVGGERSDPHLRANAQCPPGDPPRAASGPQNLESGDAP